MTSVQWKSKGGRNVCAKLSDCWSWWPFRNGAFGSARSCGAAVRRQENSGSCQGFGRRYKKLQTSDEGNRRSSHSQEGRGRSQEVGSGRKLHTLPAIRAATASKKF